MNYLLINGLTHSYNKFFLRFVVAYSLITFPCDKDIVIWFSVERIEKSSSLSSSMFD
jgi:hypothetical protein